MLRSIKIRHGVSDKAPAMIPREIPSRSDTTKLLAFESELAASDAGSSLHVFNSAICELFDLDPVWLASRPTIYEFISCAEKRLLPEGKNFWLGESC